MFKKAPKTIETAVDYWQFIDYLQNKHKKDTDAYYQEAGQRLSDMPPESSGRFAQYTGLYLSAIEECIWLDIACKAINDYVSDDTSLYFNLWVLSRGKQTLLNALLDPDSLASLKYVPYEYAEFEMFMDLGEYADEDLIASEREGLLAEIIYRGGDKLGGYTSFEDAMDDYEMLTPRLSKGREKALKKISAVDTSAIEAQVASMMSQINAPPALSLSPAPWKAEDIKKTLLPQGYTPLHGMVTTKDSSLACSYEDGKDSVLVIYQLDDESKKEIYRAPTQQGARFVSCGCSEAYLVFSYNGYDESSSAFYLYEWHSNEVREIQLPDSDSQINGGSLYGNMLYLSTISNIKNPRKMKRDILTMDIATGEFATEQEQAAEPTPTSEGLYYLRINKDYTQALMLKSWEGAEPKEIRGNVQNYSAYGSVIAYVALEPNEHVLPSFLYLYQNHQEQILIPHAMIHELNLGKDYLIFGLRSMMGTSNQTIVYSLKNSEFYEIHGENHIMGMCTADSLVQWIECIYKKNSNEAEYLINRLIY